MAVVNVYVKFEDDGTWTVRWVTGAALSDVDAVNPASYTNTITPVYDETYAGTAYKYAGWVWSHSTSTASTSTTHFDNFGAGHGFCCSHKHTHSAGDPPRNRPLWLLTAMWSSMKLCMIPSAAQMKNGVELYNTTGSAIDVSGWCLSDDDSFPSNTGEGYLLIPPGTSIAAGGYLVISDVDLTGISCEVICTEVGSYALGNSGDNLSLWTNASGTGIIIDGTLDGTQYPDLSTAGASIQKWPEGTDWSAGAWYLSTNDSGGAEHIYQTACAANTEPVDTPTPEPTLPPTDTPNTPQPTDTPVTPPPTPSVVWGDVVINEVMYNSVSGIDEEWVELYNTTSSAIDVSGWCLCDDDTFPVPTSEGYLVIPPGTTIAANGYLVISEVPMIDINL